MSSLSDGSLEFGSNGRSPAERRKLLVELRKQLPPAGPISQRGGSPAERKIALLIEFLFCMLQDKPASTSILKGHPAYAGRGFNFTGQWCMKIGLQWDVVSGKHVYPATGANMLKLFQELSEVAPKDLEELAERAAMSIDEIFDVAIAKFQDESFEPVDEFVDLPEDFQLDDGPDSGSVMSHLEEMLRPFRASQADFAESPVSAQSDDSNSECGSTEEPVAVPDDALIITPCGAPYFGYLLSTEFRRSSLIPTQYPTAAVGRAVYR